MTLSLQIAAVAAALIVGGLAALKLAADSFDRRHPPQSRLPPQD
ncbi:MULTISPECIES: hypothetical protein [unclassified Methylobacterium]|nr:MULTISPECIES: hypothetical protein [unclassified Methylobacterium]